MSQLLMSKPEHIEGASPVDLRHAQSQWKTLHDALITVGYKVECLPDVSYVKHYYAMSRHGLLIDNKALLAFHASSTHDQQTSPYLAAWCHYHAKKRPLRVETTRLHPERTVPIAYAGHADTLYIDQCLYFGYGANSVHEIANDLITKTGKRVVDLFITEPGAHLIDFVLPVHDGQIFCDPSGLHPNSVSVLADCFSLHNLQDPKACYPAQSMICGQKAIVSSECHETQLMLAEHGYEVLTIDMQFFHSMGLGPRALTLPLFV